MMGSKQRATKRVPATKRATGKRKAASAEPPPAVPEGPCPHPPFPAAPTIEAIPKEEELPEEEETDPDKSFELYGEEADISFEEIIDNLPACVTQAPSPKEMEKDELINSGESSDEDNSIGESPLLNILFFHHY
jgi:hypothetical protein